MSELHMHRNKVNKRIAVKIRVQLFTLSAHHVVDVCLELLEEIPQSAQVLAGVFPSVWAVSLAPSHRFLQPELHLLDIQRGLCHLLERDQWLRHRSACPGSSPGEFI